MPTSRSTALSPSLALSSPPIARAARRARSSRRALGAALVVALAACGGQVDRVNGPASTGGGGETHAVGDAGPTAAEDAASGGASSGPRPAPGFPVGSTVAGTAAVVGPYDVRAGQPLLLATFQDWADAAVSITDGAGRASAIAWKLVASSRAPFGGTLALYGATASADAHGLVTRVSSTVQATVVSATVLAFDGASDVTGAVYATGGQSPIGADVEAPVAGALLVGVGAVGWARPAASAGATLLASPAEASGWDLWIEAQPAAAAGTASLGLASAASHPWALIAVAVTPASDGAGGAAGGDGGVAVDGDGGGSGDGGATVGSDGGTNGGARPMNPSFGAWAWSKPDAQKIVHAGFRWFESGYPGTLSPTENQLLAQSGTTPIAYINAAEVPNDDTWLQQQIGPFYKSIALCPNTGWNTTVVDVRDARWQAWLVQRANAAYADGNRGIKWDVAGVESLCNGWAGIGGAAAGQQAVDALAHVLAQLKAQHPDFLFVVNQGFALAEQHPDLVDGLELENQINYDEAHPGDQWSHDLIARVSAIHTKGRMPIFDLEYIDLFGCADTTCGYATTLYDRIVALDWVPYITRTHMDIEGRGLGISPPW